MGLLEFSKLPINTLVGADWKTFKGVTEGRIVDKGYKQKYYLTKSVCRLLSLLQPFEDRKYKKLLADKKIENDPVFILGHWRSGTTFVHNVFSCDKQFGYNTTYQTVFPNLMLFGQSFFKKQTSLLIHLPLSSARHLMGKLLFMVKMNMETTLVHRAMEMFTSISTIAHSILMCN